MKRLKCVLKHRTFPNFSFQAAESSLRFYRNVQATGKETPLRFQEEFENLKTQLGPEVGGQIEKTPLLITDFSKLLSIQPNKLSYILSLDPSILADRVPRKAFIIGFALILLHEFCGCFTMINYTATIFAESGSDISPNLSAIICGAIQLLGTLVSTKLVDRAGRKVKKNEQLIQR